MSVEDLGAETRQARAGTPEQPAPLRAVTATELLAMQLPPRENVLGPWLTTKSLNMVYGPRGEGKTFIALGVAIAIGTGNTFLEWAALRPRRVLLIDGEMPAEVQQERIASLANGADLGNLQIVTPDLQLGPMPNLAAVVGQQALAELIEWAEVIIIDNLACLARSGDENERQSWLLVQDWLLRLRVQNKVVLLVHHAGKSGDQRGTSAREDVLDTVIKLSRPGDYREEDGLRVEWRFTKARGFHGEPARPLHVRLRAGIKGELTWVWEPLEESQLVQVVELLNTTEMSQREIAEELKISLSKAHRLKRKAEAEGLLVKKDPPRSRRK